MTVTPKVVGVRLVAIARTTFDIGLAQQLAIEVRSNLLEAGVSLKGAEAFVSELDEARALREDAQTLLASYERKQREVQDQAQRIVAHAKAEALEIAEQAKVDVQKTLERRLAAAEDQITSAQASAVREVRDRAITVAVAAAKDVVAQQMSTADASKMIDDSIAEVGAKLH